MGVAYWYLVDGKGDTASVGTGTAVDRTARRYGRAPAAGLRSLWFYLTLLSIKIQFRGEELEGLCVEELYQIVREVEAGLHRVPTTKVGTGKSLRIHNVELVPDLTLLPNTTRKPQLFPNSTGSSCKINLERSMAAVDLRGSSSDR
ncbi:hypothetical protein C2845_PM18G00850 [Panicum miliaceum]|uniref:Uncharacterized protein n=1 Tax=Panicum miliaceum TaxID=4540 RepID=A0A3L6PM95_PANMI|nr:hypothetical protein C2845_PM18G00850 [Panicum miliaceum]